MVWPPRKPTRLVQTAQYCLVLLSQYPEGVTIGVRDLAAKRDVSPKTACEHLRMLRTTYPMLRLHRRERYDPSHEDQRKAREWRLNREFVTLGLGVSLPESVALASTAIPATSHND